MQKRERLLQSQKTETIMENEINANLRKLEELRRQIAEYHNRMAGLRRTLGGI